MSQVLPSASITKLDNGLEIITHQNKHHPVAAIQIWCKTGSIHEDKWMGAGLSHVLEHMLFKGTESRPPGKIDREIQDAGGNMNAYTSFDHTVYYINIPCEEIELAIDILCDITCNATFPDEELESEKDVILREMDMLTDDPGRRSSRRLFETAFSVSPLRYPIIGLPDIYNQVFKDDVKNYYKERYVPNNMFFVVTGDIDESKVIEQIKSKFSDIPASPIPPIYIPTEPEPFSAKELIEEGPFQLGHIHLAFQTPGISHRDYVALETLTGIIGQGRSSRLNQRLRESLGIVHGIQSWHYCPTDHGLLAVSAVIDPENIEKVRTEILNVIEDLKNNPVSESELKKAIKLQRTSILSGLKTVQGVAEDLGNSWLISGNLDYSQNYLEVVEKINAEDIQRVARKWLQENRSTFYGLLPIGTSPKSSRKHKQPKRDKISRTVLDNGLVLLSCSDNSLPFVETKWATKGGILLENPANQGSSYLLAKLLGKGTQSKSSQDIAEAIESAGGSLDPFSGNNTIGTSLECLNSDWESLMKLTTEVMLQPKFESGIFDVEKNSQLAAIKAQEDQLVHQAFKIISKTLFGDSGYGLDSIGIKESVSKFAPNSILDFHKSLLLPNSTTLSVFGNIDASRVTDHLNSLFQSWKNPATRLKTSYPAYQKNDLEKKEVIFKQVDKTQAVVALGFKTTTLTDRRKFALELLQEVYSDLGSRLFTRIRDELGLAYYVSAYHFAGIHPGIFAFYAGTSPDQGDLVADEFLKEIDHLIKSGITEEELKRAKSKILGQKKISAQSLGSMAMASALDELYELGYDNYYNEIMAYENVTLDDIHSAINDFFIDKPYVLSFVSPESTKRSYTQIDYN